MPGPKMGPRPADFCEELVKQSPTFVKWEALQKGEKLRYACRDFIKGHDQDEERLMRRIMIARRNNLRDHAILKRARKKQDDPDGSGNAGVGDDGITTTTTTTTTDAGTTTTATTAPTPTTTTTRKRRPASSFSDSQVAKEMDVAAVEATRSYRAWLALPDGAEFVYNQRYYKGRQNQDWLLKKNIWRRMRYRRENKKLVNKLREDDPSISVPREQGIYPQPQQKQQAASQAELNPGHISVKIEPTSTTAQGPVAPVPTKSEPTPTLNISIASAGTKRAAEESDQHEKPPAKVGKVAKAGPLEELPSVGPGFPAIATPLPETSTTEVPALPSVLGVEDSPSGLVPIPHPAPVLVGTDHHHHHHHHAPPPPPLTGATSGDHHDDETTAALTAAAAATASGAADDLVELSAVEAAVAAAASYAASYAQNNDHNDDDDDDVVDDDEEVDLVVDAHHHHHHATSVHNPLEAAANAAALDSAAKLAAAAATAQEVNAAAQQVAEEDHHSHQEALAALSERGDGRISV